MTTMRRPSVCTSRGTRTGGGCLAKIWYTSISCRCRYRADRSPSGSTLIMTGWSPACPAASSDLPSWGSIFSTRSPANWPARAASTGGTRWYGPPDAGLAGSSGCVNSVTVPSCARGPVPAVIRAVQLRLPVMVNQPGRSVKGTDALPAKACWSLPGAAPRQRTRLTGVAEGTGRAGAADTSRAPDRAPASSRMVRGPARAARMVPVTDVYLEVGKKRVFACAADWPGWCRSGRDEEQALEALATSVSRYAVLAALAGVPFDPVDEVDCIQIAETVTGSATT